MTAPNFRKIKCCANCYFLTTKEYTEPVEPNSIYKRIYGLPVCELHEDVVYKEGTSFALYVCDDFDSSERESE